MVFTELVLNLISHSVLQSMSIFWFVKNYPEFFTHFDCCGTIMDFVVAMITDNHDEKPVMSAHNAASWGYFDTVSNKVN